MSTPPFNPAPPYVDVGNPVKKHAGEFPVTLMNVNFPVRTDPPNGGLDKKNVGHELSLHCLKKLSTILTVKLNRRYP
jgi:hypothetical protein